MRIGLSVPGEFGRMAAQTAKQVITQKLREAEREIVYAEFKGQEGQIVMGSIQRKEGRVVLVDIGRTTAVVRAEDQIPTERYNAGERMKFCFAKWLLVRAGRVSSLALFGRFCSSFV